MVDQRLRFVFWEVVGFKLFDGGDSRPVLLGGRACSDTITVRRAAALGWSVCGERSLTQQPENKVELVFDRGAREQRPTCSHLVEDTAHPPADTNTHQTSAETSPLSERDVLTLVKSKVTDQNQNRVHLVCLLNNVLKL